MADHLHSNCDSLLQSLSELLDGTLSDEMCAEIKQHLESCDNCRAVFNTTRRTIDLVRMPPEGSTALPADIRERLFKRLDLEGFLGKPPA
jgi:anti-sigma factor (TIGR02949 family)